MPRFARRLSVVFTCMTILATQAHAGMWQSLGPYEGSLGKKDIAVRLEREPDGRLIGTFFYRDKGRDIRLMPLSEDHMVECPLEATRGMDHCDRPSGYWELTLDADGARGSRSDGNHANPLPIRLTALPRHPGEDRDVRFNALRMAHARIETVGKRQSDGVTWEIHQERLSGQSMPHLTGGVDKAAMDAINADLDRQLRESATESLEAVTYQATPGVLFANRRYFTVGGQREYYFPGAAHPSGGFAATTYNLRTGRPMRWDTTFLYTDAHTATIRLSRPDLLAALVLRYASAAAAHESDDSGCFHQVIEYYGCRAGTCRITEDLAKNDPNWIIYPTLEGLRVHFDVFPEVSRNCRTESFSLPWEEVRKTLIAPVDMP